MTDTHAIGSTARTLRGLIRHGHSPMWRESALEAMRQERGVYWAMDNYLAMAIVDAALGLVENWTEEVKNEIKRDLARALLIPRLHEDTGRTK